MPEASSAPAATAVARLSTDAATAQEISDAMAEHFDAEAVATSDFEEPDGRWSIALHFRDQPDEAAVRALVAAAAGSCGGRRAGVRDARARPTGCARASTASPRSRPAASWCTARTTAARVRANRIAIEIEAALAFGTGHHGTTRGCLLALDRIKRRRAQARRQVAATSAPAPACWRSQRRRRCAGQCLRATSIARAVAVARDNARINRAAAICRGHPCGRPCRAPVSRARAPFDLILANILLEPLAATGDADGAAGRAERQRRALGAAGARKPARRWRAIAPRASCSRRRIRLEGWVTLVLRRPDAVAA